MTLKESTFQKKVEKGLHVSSKKLVEKKRKMGQTLIVSKGDKILHIKASDIELD